MDNMEYMKALKDLMYAGEELIKYLESLDSEVVSDFIHGHLVVDGFRIKLTKAHCVLFLNDLSTGGDKARDQLLLVLENRIGALENQDKNDG